MNGRKDVYSRVTDRIIADLEKGVRSWMKPWNAGHTAGRITRPLRHNGTPYQGINILMLWGEALDKGYSAPIWMTYNQAQELGAHVRKGQQGSLVVYANKITLLPFEVLRSAGGAESFIDVMLSTEMPLAA